MTVYRGDGLRAHLDKNFQGPVFVVTIMIRQHSKDSKADQHKKISFGMRKGREMNPEASMDNEERQLYLFFGWLTDWGVHGVPKMKGWTSIVLIIRHPRWEELSRRAKPCS